MWSILYEVNGCRVDRTEARLPDRILISFIHVSISVDISSKEHTILCTMIMSDPAECTTQGLETATSHRRGSL